MKITNIALNDDGRPDLITAKLTRAELLYIGLTIGGHSGEASEKIMQGGSHIATDLYQSITGDLFNRYYDDGIDGAARGDNE
jgi:hypothetical protein